MYMEMLEINCVAFSMNDVNLTKVLTTHSLKIYVIFILKKLNS